MVASSPTMRLSTIRLALTLVLLVCCSHLVEGATERPKGDFRKCVEITPSCPLEATLYGYSPILSINALFIAIFGFCCIASIGIGIFSRTWTYTIALGIGTFLETVGYGGRIMMTDNPWTESGFRLQIVALVLAPSFIAAAIYLTLKHFVLYCGPQYSVIKARLYPWIFIGCDIGSIALQSIGGGMAAAGGNNNLKLVNSGNNMIVAGIAFQVATMAVCGLLLLVYIWRYRKGAAQRVVEEKSNYQLHQEQGHVSTWKVKGFGWMVILAYLTVLIRCIYRLPEMAGGWGNPLMRNEPEFLLLDGMMIAIACVALTVFHPAFFFPPFAVFRIKK